MTMGRLGARLKAAPYDIYQRKMQSPRSTVLHALSSGSECSVFCPLARLLAALLFLLYLLNA
ncbi:MAG: hypothetical protein KDD69_06840 [Bdellovibrionales bacterium]|nr:hypothetical protein [Bdellovibrionales bacterium]